LAIWDLHCHSSASDGELSPAALLARAAERGVTHLAITDHDTVDGFTQLESQLQSQSETQSQPQLISGVEITCRHDRQVVHMVGLWIDPHSMALQTFLAKQCQLRLDRGQAINDRLVARGLPATLDGALKLAEGSALGRPHFARYLTEIGITKSFAEAFQRWLGKGKPGDVDIEWPDLHTTIALIHQASGKAVLAHPAKYKLGFNKIYTLCEQFKADGGDAIEVVSGAQKTNETKDLSRIAARLELAASTGSDFHSPQQLWCDLGAQPQLPDSCQPIWNQIAS